MAVFFKFDVDGTILVARTRFSSKIGEKEFERKAKVIDEERFLSKYPKEGKILKTQIEKLKFIHEQRISRVGLVMQYLYTEGMYPSGCFVGDRYFPRGHEDGEEKAKAIDYGYCFYSKKFMDEIIKKKYLFEPPEDFYKKSIDDWSIYSGSHFFAGEERITEEEYVKYMTIIKELTGIRDARKPLETRTPKVNIKR